MKPLFMWAGGKNKMLEKYGPYLPNKFDKYIEPFFGGGAMFIWAYNKCPDAEFVINDLNENIIGIYSAVKNDCEKFLNKVDELQSEYIPLAGPDKIKTNKELQKKHKMKEKGRFDWSSVYKEEPSRRHFYFSLRDEYAFEYSKWNKTEEAAVLYFLMKTGFNGVWQINGNTNGRFGTPCGLLNQKEVVYDKENVLDWNKALQNVTVCTGDYFNTLQYVTNNSYVFLDPPYRGCFADYGTKSDDQFQQEVVNFLNECKKKGAYGLLSNRHIGDNFFVDRVLNNKIEYFDVTYTVGRRKKTENGFEAKKAVEILMIANET